ncbi:hypothetical protein C5167_016602 [Papaver somniferum]|nr:hypothetical protein C5167_016602 [Papaver somniferum]
MKMKLCKFGLACKFYRANPYGASIPAPTVPGLACKFYRANPSGASMPAPTVIHAPTFYPIVMSMDFLDFCRCVHDFCRCVHVCTPM